MLIDWFTVGAQALNFIILVWLLKRFLYKPVLAAVDAREKKIAAELADADAKKADAQKERDNFAQKNAAFDQQRAALMQKATKDAGAERQRLLDAAGKAADALAAKRRDSLQVDAVALGKAIHDLTRQEVFAIARQALTDLASTSLETAMVACFVQRLQTMDATAKADLGNSLKALTAPVVVRCAFDLPDAQQAAVRQALHDAFATDGAAQFATAPDLVSGIELTAGGQKIAWSIDDYLAAMAQGVGALVKPDEAKPPAPKSDAKPKAHKHKVAHA